VFVKWLMSGLNSKWQAVAVALLLVAAVGMGVAAIASWREWLTAEPLNMFNDECQPPVDRTCRKEPVYDLVFSVFYGLVCIGFSVVAVVAVRRFRRRDEIHGELLTSGRRTPGTLVSSTVNSRGDGLVQVFEGTVPSGFHEGMTVRVETESRNALPVGTAVTIVFDPTDIGTAFVENLEEVRAESPRGKDPLRPAVPTPRGRRRRRRDR
jgi:hypothetical protein